MVWKRWHTGLWLMVSILLTVALTAVLWFVFEIPGLVGFLFLPFLLYGARIFGGKSRDVDEHAAAKSPGDARTCPVCGESPREPWDRYCPRDGSYLR